MTRDRAKPDAVVKGPAPPEGGAASREYRVVFTGENECVIEPFAPPVEIEPDAVVVRNRISLISAGTELAMLRKRHRAFTTDGPSSSYFTFPFYPGYAGVGEVSAVGSAVVGIEVGDVVVHRGSHATLCVVPSGKCKVVPDGIEPERVVFFSLVQIAMTAIRRAPAQLGDVVLVSGSGLVGLLCAQLYRLAGASVAVADPAPGRLEKAGQLGFEALIDLGRTTLEDWYAGTAGPAPDISVEAAGVESNIAACLRVTRDNGRVILLGAPRKPMEIDPYSDIMFKGLSVIGAHERTVGPAVRAADVPYLWSLCRSGLALDLLCSCSVPYTDASEMYDKLDGDIDNYLGVLFTY